MKDPGVSVLVTVFNREAYLGAALTSILASTFEDFEVVIVDDASSDNSYALAVSIAETDDRVRVVRNEDNLGDYGNRRRAAELARGRYLKYVDSDDTIYPHGLGIMVQAMDMRPDAALGISHSMPEQAQPYPWKLSPRETWLMEFLGVGALASGPSGAIIRRDRFFEVGGFRDWGVLSDTDLWMRLSARWPTVLLPPGLVWWRRHDGQEFTRSDAARTYLEQGFRLQMDALASNESPLDAEEIARAMSRARQHYARKLWSVALKQAKPGSALTMFRRSQLGFADLVSGLTKYT